MPSVTVETLPLTLTGAIIMIINNNSVMSPVLRPSGARSSGRPTQRDPSDLTGPRSAMVFDHWCRTAAAPHDVRVCAGVTASLLAAFLQERQGLDLGCVLRVSYTLALYSGQPLLSPPSLPPFYSPSSLSFLVDPR